MRERKAGISFGSGSQRGGHGGSNNGVWILCGGRMAPARMDVLAASSSTSSIPEGYGMGKMEMRGSCSESTLGIFPPSVAARTIVHGVERVSAR